MDTTRVMVNSERAHQIMRKMLDEMVCIYAGDVCVRACVRARACVYMLYMFLQFQHCLYM